MNRYMRILVFFDLPVTTTAKRKVYSRFRKFLLNDGYDMIQFSVYSRICKGLDGVDKHMNRLETAIPEEGSVRSMIVTEKQYNDMKILLGDPTPQENSLQDSLFTLL